MPNHSEWTLAASFPTRMEADIAKLLLENHGLEVKLVSDDMGGLQPALSLTSGVELWVLKEDLHDALKILNSSPDPDAFPS